MRKGEGREGKQGRKDVSVGGREEERFVMKRKGKGR